MSCVGGSVSLWLFGKMFVFSTFELRPKNLINQQKWFFHGIFQLMQQTNKIFEISSKNCFGSCGVFHNVALPFTLKSILMQNKNYGNSKYFTMQKNNLPKILEKKKPKYFKIL